MRTLGSRALPGFTGKFDCVFVPVNSEIVQVKGFPSSLYCLSRLAMSLDKEWEKLENISAWNLTKVGSKKEVIDEARTKGAKVHFASLMDICHLKNAELEAKHQKNKGRVVLRGDIVKDDPGLTQYSPNKDHHITNDSSKSHGYHLQIARLRWTSSRRSICLYPGKNGRCFQIIENSKIGMSRHLDSSTTTRMA